MYLESGNTITHIPPLTHRVCRHRADIVVYGQQSTMSDYLQRYVRLTGVVS